MVRNRADYQLICKDKSLTKQSFKKDVNINNIMSRYKRTQVLDYVNSNPGIYGDFSDVTDYQGALNQIMAARELFESLPAEIRKNFDNDPAKFLDFADNPENETKMIEMGLLNAPEPAPEPAPAPLEPEPTPV